MKKLILVLACLLLTAGAYAQGPNIDRATFSTTQTGATWTVQNQIGVVTFSLEILVTGSPSTLSVVTKGCMRGGTCDTLDTYASTANVIRQVRGNYDNFQITPSWTGGTSVNVTLNTLVKNSASPIPVTAVNLAAQPIAGPIAVEKGGRWSVVSNPAAGSQATAGKAAGAAGVRHVVDCVSFSAGATTAPALTALTLNVRDGATGAGTILWTYEVIIPAATGQSVAPQTACGLGLMGSAATAMTFEFSGALANLVESVSISGMDVQ